LDSISAAFHHWRIATVASNQVSFWLLKRIEPLAHFLALALCLLSTQLETGKKYGVSLSLEGAPRRDVVKLALSLLIFLPIAVKRMTLGFVGMSSVEKVFEYIQRVPQEQRDGMLLDKAWPMSGALDLRDVCLKYSPSLPDALSCVSLTLPHGSKVGICGRTGCGKSSLFVALFRLVDPHAGHMQVDGVDVCRAQLDALRCRMSIIPQDPVLFGGSLRENIDPLGLYSDGEVQVLRPRAASKMLRGIMSHAPAGGFGYCGPRWQPRQHKQRCRHFRGRLEPRGKTAGGYCCRNARCRNARCRFFGLGCNLSFRSVVFGAGAAEEAVAVVYGRGAQSL
jgi:ABC-type multidrug transport system fused ATPase/permease subunit